MNHKEQSELLLSAIQQLMELYKDICDKIPKLNIVYNSELKKIPQKF